jgi:para-nitrobenzyl esterase
MYKKYSFLNRNFLGLLFGMIFLATTIGCSSLGFGVSGAPTLTGVFIDSPVAGITYKTPTLGGLTDAAGTFHYKAGEVVTFSIGGVVLGSAPGKPILTPLDIVAGAKDTADQRVTNISAFLQTLDQDGNPANGITISSKTASFVEKYGKGINFNKHIRAFSFDGAFRQVMTELNEVDAFGDIPRAVMSPKVAKKNLDAAISKLKK